MARSKQGRRRKSRPVPRRSRIESLESRRVLATFTADFLTDSVGGTCAPDDATSNVNCSLRSAIMAAEQLPGADTIEIVAGAHNIDGLLGSLAISTPEDITFVGLGATPADVVIDGQNAVGLFEFRGASTNYTVEFRNLTIQNGQTDSGIAPAIDTPFDANLNLRSVVLQNNTAETNTLGFGNSGGAIIARGNVDIQDSQFLNNTASSDAGAIFLSVSGHGDGFDSQLDIQREHHRRSGD